MMVTNGDRFLEYSYPSLDSRTRKGYIHNTSGISKAKLSESDSHEEPDPDRAKRERKAREASESEALQAQDPNEEPVFSQVERTLGSSPSKDYGQDYGQEKSEEGEEDDEGGKDEGRHMRESSRNPALEERYMEEFGGKDKKEY